MESSIITYYVVSYFLLSDKSTSVEALPRVGLGQMRTVLGRGSACRSCCVVQWDGGVEKTL